MDYMSQLETLLDEPAENELDGIEELDIEREQALQRELAQMMEINDDTPLPQEDIEELERAEAREELYAAQTAVSTVANAASVAAGNSSVDTSPASDPEQEARKAYKRAHYYLTRVKKKIAERSGSFTVEQAQVIAQAQAEAEANLKAGRPRKNKSRSSDPDEQEVQKNLDKWRWRWRKKNPGKEPTLTQEAKAAEQIRVKRRAKLEAENAC